MIPSSPERGLMSVRIIVAENGVPAVARCNTCEERWLRRADDPEANDLVDFTVRHRLRHGDKDVTKRRSSSRSRG